jgi:vacuolar-type H+-ATPase subunit I/STV1
VRWDHHHHLHHHHHDENKIKKYTAPYTHARRVVSLFFFVLQCCRTHTTTGTMPLAITEIGQLPAGTSPPTYFETNKFTSVFQGIVDTYGVGT